MMPSMPPFWYEDMLRRKRGLQGPVPPDLMGGVTPPFNPDAGSQMPPRPQRPMDSMEEDPPLQIEAQKALGQRVQDLEAARQRQREMPGWRKAIGGVLEGIGSGRRGPLGGLARVGGGALTGRNAVRDVEQDIPYYDRAADNERQANIQAENAALRRSADTDRRENWKMRHEERTNQQALRYEQFRQNREMEEVGDGFAPFDPKRHVGTPTTVEVNGAPHLFARKRPEVIEKEVREARLEAAMSPVESEDLGLGPVGTMRADWEIAQARQALNKRRAQEAAEKEARKRREAEASGFLPTPSEQKEYVATGKVPRKPAAPRPNYSAARDAREIEAKVLADDYEARLGGADAAIKALQSDQTIDPAKKALAMEELRKRKPKTRELIDDLRAGVAALGATPGVAAKPKPSADSVDLPDPRQYAGKTATNKKTGQRMRSDGTRWIPVP